MFFKQGRKNVFSGKGPTILSKKDLVAPKTLFLVKERRSGPKNAIFGNKSLLVPQTCLWEGKGTKKSFWSQKNDYIREIQNSRPFPFSQTSHNLSQKIIFGPVVGWLWEGKEIDTERLFLESLEFRES